MNRVLFFYDSREFTDAKRRALDLKLIIIQLHNGTTGPNSFKADFYGSLILKKVHTTLMLGSKLNEGGLIRVQ